MTRLETLKAAALAALDAANTAADAARDAYKAELKKIHEENCNG